MATKKAEIQNNEKISNDEKIKKEENIEVEVEKNTNRNKKITKKAEGTTRKGTEKTTELAKKTTTTTKKSTAKKNTEKSTASKKSGNTTKRKTNSTKKIDEKVETSKKEENEVNQEAENKEKENSEVVPQEKIVKIEEIKKTIKNKKELPKEEIKKINKMLFKNIMIAIGIIVYFIFLNLGKMNIENSVYVTDLKVFSMCTLLAAIILIEVAYKKDSGEITLYGIEMIMLAITTFALIYVNLMLSSRYVYIVTAISFIFAIYYLIKSMVIYLKKRKQYFVDDMKEIMNKEEVE